MRRSVLAGFVDARNAAMRMNLDIRGSTSGSAAASALDLRSEPSGLVGKPAFSLAQDVASCNLG